MSPIAAQPPSSTRIAARSLLAPPSLHSTRRASQRRRGKATARGMGIRHCCRQVQACANLNLASHTTPLSPGGQAAKSGQAEGSARNHNAGAHLQMTGQRICGSCPACWLRSWRTQQTGAPRPACALRTFQSVTKAAPSRGMPAPHENVMADTAAACSGRAKLSTSEDIEEGEVRRSSGRATGGASLRRTSGAAASAAPLPNP